MAASHGRRSGEGEVPDPAKRQDIFLLYWYPDYADPFSWFINLFHSSDPPYFNLAYYDNARGQADRQLSAPGEGRPRASRCTR